MTIPGVGSSSELASVFINCVPSMAGSQQIFQALARSGADDFAKTFQDALASQLPRALEQVGRSAAQGFSAGLGANAAGSLLSHLLPTEGAIRSHMGRLGGAGAKSYVDEYERNFKNLTPVIEDASAKAIAASKALVETTAAMGGWMGAGFRGFSKETMQATDEMSAAVSSKLRIGGAAAGALMAFELVHNVKKVVGEFEHVGEDAANTLVGGFESLLQGKMPDLMQPFNVFEEGAKAAFDAPLELLKTFVPTAGLVEKAFDGLTFGALDRFKAALSPVIADIVQVGDQYLGLQRKLAEATVNPEDLERLSGAVRDIMASGAVVNFEDIADSIGRLNANIKGLDTGHLKELATTFAEAEELVGRIDPTKFAGILNAWDIPADQANDTLTMLTNTARATGINFNELTGEMTKAGPAMRELGYNAEDTASFFAEMTQEGEKGTRLLFGMNDIVAKLNELVAKGVFKDVKSGWASVIEEVKAYLAAGDDVSAFNLLKQFMPANSATLMLENIKNGIIGIGEAGQHIKGLHQDLSEVVERTKDLGQTFRIVGQQISAALAPVGMGLAVGLRDAGTHVSEWLKDNQGKVAQWGVDVVRIFATVMGTAAKLFVDTLAFLGPVFDAMKAAFSTAARIVLDIVRPVLDAIGDIPGMGGLHKVAADLNNVRQLLDSTQPFSFDKLFTSGSNAVDSFMDVKLPQILAKGQNEVDDLKIDEKHRKSGFKIWFDDDDPTKVKVKAKTDDGKDIKDSSDLVPPGETTLTFTPRQGWNTLPTAPTPLPGFAFGGPTVQGAWVPGKDSIPAMLEVGEYVVRRDQAQKHRRELDMINYGHAGFDTGGEVDPGLRVLYSFLRGAAGAFGLNLPKDKSGGGSGLPSMYQNVASLSGPQPTAAGHGGDVKSQAYQAMLAAGGQPSDWPAVDYIFQHESSWNPGAINKTDINWQQGHPSTGLGQLIPSNYQAAGVGPTPTDPYAQTFAAVKYMQSRYGGIQQAYQYWLGHHNYAEGGHVGGGPWHPGGGSWYGSGDHKSDLGMTSSNLFKHFSKGFAGGGLACDECGGAHPTAFHGGGIAHFGEGGGVGGVSQVIWSNSEDPTVQAAHGDAGIGIGYGKVWSGGPGSPYSDETNPQGQGFSGHHGHVHTTFTANPFTGEKYGIADQNTTLGDWSAFPPWVRQLGDMYGLDAKTYTGHQVFKSDGLNHGIDWYPRGKQDMSGKSYSHNDNVTLTGFAQSAMAVGTGRGRFGTQAGNSGFMEFGSQFPSSSGVQLTGYDVPQGGSLPGGPFPTDGGPGSDTSGGSPFNGGSGGMQYPLGPQGIIGPGYNPWTNPPPGLSPQKMDEFTNKYLHWQLDEQKRQDRLGDLTTDYGKLLEEEKQLRGQLNDDLGAFNKRVGELAKSKDPDFAGKSDQEIADILRKRDDPAAKKIDEEQAKLKELDERTLRDKKQDVQDAQLGQQAGNPPPQPGKDGSQQGGPFQGIAQQFGGGLVKGGLQALGFPDVFGKPFTDWGIWKLAMGGLGFGMNVLNSYADRAMAGNGGPLAGLIPGGGGFPGSLPGLSGGPQGMPPGPPPGSPLPPAPQPTPDQPHTGGGWPVGPGNKPSIPGVTPPKSAPQQPQHQVGTPPPPGRHWHQKPDGTWEAVPDGGGLDLPKQSLGSTPGDVAPPVPHTTLSGFIPPTGRGYGGNALFDRDSAAWQQQNDYWTGKNGAPPKTWYSGMGGVMTGGLPPGVGSLLSAAAGMVPGGQGQVLSKAVQGSFGGGGGSASSANQIAGQMQNLGGKTTDGAIYGGSPSVNFIQNNSGITTAGQVGSVMDKQIQTKSWPGAFTGGLNSQG